MGKKLYNFKIFLSYLIGTGFGLGYSPFAPGTAGSLGGVAIYLLLHKIFESHGYLFPILIFLTACAGTISASIISQNEGEEDPSKVVIDEILGQFLALIMLPFSYKIIAASFFIFRILDILKPFPARRSEKLKNGVGIMIDDAIVGIYTNLILRIFIYIFPGIL